MQGSLKGMDTNFKICKIKFRQVFKNKFQKFETLELLFDLETYKLHFPVFQNLISNRIYKGNDAWNEIVNHIKEATYSNKQNLNIILKHGCMSKYHKQIVV